MSGTAAQERLKTRRGQCRNSTVGRHGDWRGAAKPDKCRTGLIWPTFLYPTSCGGGPMPLPGWLSLGRSDRHRVEDYCVAPGRVLDGFDEWPRSST